MDWFPFHSSDGISFIGVSIIAKSNVLVCASSWSDDGLNDRIFFDTITTNDQAQFQAGFKAYDDSLQKEISLVTTNFPVFQEFVQGNIKAGDNAENLIKVWPPQIISRFGPWIALRWLPENPSQTGVQLFGIKAIAKNGILVYANSFSDDGHLSKFFNTETPNDERDFETAYRAFEQNSQTLLVTNITPP
jgi:hypothetical protein